MSISETYELPSLSALLDFLERRAQALEISSPPKSESVTKPSPSSNSQNKPHARVHHAQSKTSPAAQSCRLCQQEHHLMMCDVYRKKTASEKKAFVDQNKLCFNCLGRHAIAQCASTNTCLKCRRKHHTSLHDAFNPPSSAAASAPASPPSTSSTPVEKTSHQCSFSTASVLLATARILVADHGGSFQITRALIDQGSETSIISERLAQRLRLKKSQTSVAIFGVGGAQTGVARGQVSVRIRSQSGRHEILAAALMMSKLTAYPAKLVEQPQAWSHLDGLILADPNYLSNDHIDLILGTDVHANIILSGLRKGKPNEPIAQNTTLGWILSGKLTQSTESNEVSSMHGMIGDPLSDLVRAFWEQEELLSPSETLTTEEIRCEEYYRQTVTRTESGRYMVRLPMKLPLTDISDTRANARRALIFSEKEFLRNPELKDLYISFLKQYQDMGHMTHVADYSGPGQVAFLPHHGVVRESSSTTRLRVVFNGSAKTAQGFSLNSQLLTGANLLPNLADVLLKWRLHKFVMVSDVEKMYRQILVDPRDRDFQKILWRERETESIKEFRLNTVTYGLACAPFLAIRTMRQLAEDEKEAYPLASTVLKQDMYVDDVLTGADTEESLLTMREQLVNLCQAGGFPLQKWATNSPCLLTLLQKEKCSEQTSVCFTDKQDTHLTLGLVWHPLDDVFSITVNPPTTGPTTRRTLLSQAAQLFDPLGWLTPITVRAKILIQSTWLLNVGCDVPLPPNIASKWNGFRDQWSCLTSLHISRPIRHSDSDRLEVMGFCDASELAYAAVLYLRETMPDSSYHFSMLTAKSKVAPLKQISLPRLELCAAVLLSRLTCHVLSTLHLEHLHVHLWTDSTVVLGWIKGHPKKWATYVANRVSEIQRTVPSARWHHIPGVQNPADCASRGLQPSELLDHPLWWHGPQIPLNLEQLPEDEDESTLSEQRCLSVQTASVQSVEENFLLERFSSLTPLLNFTAWSLRWRHRTHSKLGPSSKELQDAELLWVKLSQSFAYQRERQELLDGSQLSKGSSLTPLTPFVDEDGILRVGGRLTYSSLPYERRHLIILPPRSRFTQLMIEAYHKKTLHGGIELTLCSLRQRFWIPQARSLIKRVIHNCISCVRWRAAKLHPLMSSLPAARVSPARPFSHTGLDYAGPVLLRTAAGRGHKSYKVFIAVFVCLSTKAVHLEAVSNYTTESFLAAFKRFISRRGFCSDLYSDNGTNFVGANREFQRVFSASSSETKELSRNLASLRVTWHFNPPSGLTPWRIVGGSCQGGEASSSTGRRRIKANL